MLYPRILRVENRSLIWVHVVETVLMPEAVLRQSRDGR